MRVIFLGTAGSFPTIHRNLPAVAVHRKNELFLFDCGEGVQRQMFIAKIGFKHRLKVFISHMHGDHVFGLPGLLQTMSLLDIKRPLEIYGPNGIHGFLKAVVEIFNFDLTFPIIINEINAGIICDEKDYQIRSVWTEHGIPNLSFAIIEKERPGKFHPDKAVALNIPEGPLWSKLQHGDNISLNDGSIIVPEQVVDPPRLGRKLVYSGDTRPCDALLELAKGADLLIHEATFDDDLAEKAEQSGHSTPSQAALLAKKAAVKRLVLTHISSRYGEGITLLEQAKKIFQNVIMAEDFLEINIPHPS